MRERQNMRGDIISLIIVSCTGDDAVRRSVEAAMNKSSPLPLPANPDLFRAELELNLRP